MIANHAALAGLFIDPGRFDLEALGNLGGSEYFIHRWEMLLVVQIECKAV